MKKDRGAGVGAIDSENEADSDEEDRRKKKQKVESPKKKKGAARWAVKKRDRHEAKDSEEDADSEEESAQKVPGLREPDSRVPKETRASGRTEKARR